MLCALGIVLGEAVTASVLCCSGALQLMYSNTGIESTFLQVSVLWPWLAGTSLVEIRLTSNLMCSSYFHLLSAGITGMGFHTQSKLPSLEKYVLARHGVASQ